MSALEINFGEWFNRALAVYKVQWLPLVVVVAALAMGVGVVGSFLQRMLLAHPFLALLLQLGITVCVTGPVMVGLARHILRLCENPEQAVDLGVAFRAALEGYQQFKDAAVVYLIVGGTFYVAQYLLDFFLWPMLALLAAAVVAFFVGTATMFSVWLMAEHKCGYQAALLGSWNAVKDNFHTFLIFNLMALGVGISGVIACGIGVVATLPLYLCLMAVAFREVFPTASLVEPAAPAL